MLVLITVKSSTVTHTQQSIERKLTGLEYSVRG